MQSDASNRKKNLPIAIFLPSRSGITISLLYIGSVNGPGEVMEAQC